MSLAAVGSVKSAAGRGTFAFVWQPGVRVACVRVGMGVFASHRGSPDGRHRTDANRCRGWVRNQCQAAGPRLFAPRRRVHTRTHVSGGQRLGRGCAAHWMMATSACIIGAALAAVQMHTAWVQTEQCGTGSVLRGRAAAEWRRGAA